MSNIITTLHPKGSVSDNLYPNIQKDNIPNGSIDSTKLDNNGVTNSKIADNAVTTDKIQDGNVTHSKLDDSCVDTNNIANSSITTNKLQQGAVTGSKIADDTIITDNLHFNIYNINCNFVAEYDNGYLEFYLNWVNTYVPSFDGDSIPSIIGNVFGRELWITCSGRIYDTDNPHSNVVAITVETDNTISYLLADNTIIYDPDITDLRVNDQSHSPIW